MSTPATAAVLRLAARQERAVSRAQVLAAGATEDWISSQVRRRSWQRLWPGVYATVTGPVPFMTRAYGALLYAGPGAVLGPHASAFLNGMESRPPRTVDVLVPTERRARSQPGLVVRRSQLSGRYLGIPPRLSGVATTISLVEAAGTPDAVVAALCAAVRVGVDPAAVRAEVTGRARVRGRALLLDVLADVEAGVESPLEHRYHLDVERRHGLPAAQLQRRQVLAGLRLRADRVYVGLGVRAELDGSLAHPGGRTDRDTWRDNEVGIGERELTLRYRWTHVAAQPCRTAEQVARALRSRGWAGGVRRCGPRCPAGAHDGRSAAI